MVQKTILIVDDEDDIRMLIRGLLEDEGYYVIDASNSRDAFTAIEQYAPSLVIQDIWLEGSDQDGIDILKKCHSSSNGNNPPFLMISGHGTIETAVSTIKFGAYDFIEKPFNSDRLLLMVRRALESDALRKENMVLKGTNIEKIDTLSRQLPIDIVSMLNKVSATNSRLLICGEPGVGKEIAAQYVHAHSNRKDAPFKVFHCAGLSDADASRGLFGGQDQDGVFQPGLLSFADRGTLVLNEVHALPLSVQGKLLSFLQDGVCENGADDVPVDVRICTTSSEDMQECVRAKTFREDLYYRLNVVTVDIPPLRTRKRDIEKTISGLSSIPFSHAALSILQSYTWPGNIKQLNNVIDWVAIMFPDISLVEPEHLPQDIQKREVKSGELGELHAPVSFSDDVLLMGLRDARECFERSYLTAQLEKNDGNISKTAESIGMERSALHRKLKSLEVFTDEKHNVA